MHHKKRERSSLCALSYNKTYPFLLCQHIGAYLLTGFRQALLLKGSTANDPCETPHLDSGSVSKVRMVKQLRTSCQFPGV